MFKSHSQRTFASVRRTRCAGSPDVLDPAVGPAPTTTCAPHTPPLARSRCQAVSHQGDPLPDASPGRVSLLALQARRHIPVNTPPLQVLQVPLVAVRRGQAVSGCASNVSLHRVERTPATHPGRARPFVPSGRRRHGTQLVRRRPPPPARCSLLEPVAPAARLHAHELSGSVKLLLILVRTGSPCAPRTAASALRVPDPDPAARSPAASSAARCFASRRVRRDRIAA